MFNVEYYVFILMLKNIIRVIVIKFFYCYYIIFYKIVIINNIIIVNYVFFIFCNLGLMEVRLIRMVFFVRMVRLFWLG